MVLKKIIIKLTEEEASLLDSGEITLLGLAKKSSNQQIYKHLPIVNQRNNISYLGNKKGLLIGIGVVAAVSATAIIACKVIKSYKKTMSLDDEQIAISYRYNEAMVNYVKKAQKGKLAFSDVKKFADFFDDLVKDYQNGDVKIELTAEEINVLYGIIYKFSKELCAKNNEVFCNIPQIENALEIDNGKKVENMRDMLLLQEKVFLKNKLHS